MRTLSFLSKFTVICNIAFLFFIFFRWIDIQKNAAGKSGELISLPFLKELVIILGFTAIIINIIMHIVYLILYFAKKSYLIPRTLALINFIFLALQLFYFS